MASEDVGDDDMELELPEVKNDADASASTRPQSIHMETHIGSKLKALYSEVVNQPVPDRLLELLQKLEAKGGRLEDK